MFWTQGILSDMVLPSGDSKATGILLGTWKRVFMNRVHSLLFPLLNPRATALTHHCRLPVMTPQARLGLDSPVTKSHWRQNA